MPPLGPGDPPFTLLIDYDGTIALTDVADRVMAEYVTGEWEEEAARYDAGQIGSRRLMNREMELLRRTPKSSMATAAAQPHDPSFVPFVERARGPGSRSRSSRRLRLLHRPGAPAPRVSAGPGVRGADHVRGRWRVDRVPQRPPGVLRVRDLQANRVLAHRAAGRRVIFIGDGESDRYAAGYADVVFAKRRSAHLRRQRLAVPPLDGVRRDRRLVPDTVDAWRADGSLPAPVDRPFFCGPEVWGEGHWDPPAPNHGEGTVAG